MNGWQWFWTLVGFIIFIIVLIFLRWYQPFADLFNIVITSLSYENSILWAVVIIGIIGFCGYHWRRNIKTIINMMNPTSVQNHCQPFMMGFSLKSLFFSF